MTHRLTSCRPTEDLRAASSLALRGPSSENDEGAFPTFCALRCATQTLQRDRAPDQNVFGQWPLVSQVAVELSERFVGAQMLERELAESCIRLLGLGCSGEEALQLAVDRNRSIVFTDSTKVVGLRKERCGSFVRFGHRGTARRCSSFGTDSTSSATDDGASRAVTGFCLAPLGRDTSSMALAGASLEARTIHR